MTVRVVVWDVGGVLLRLSLEEGFQKLGALYGKSAGEIRMLMDWPEFHQFERSEIFFDEFVAVCDRRFGGKVPTDQFARCLEAQLAGPAMDVIAVRDELHAAGVLLATASNVNSVHYVHIRSRFPDVHRNVHVVGASHEMGVRKGDAAFFPGLRQLIQEKIGLDVEYQHMAFVDDIEANIRFASAHGIRGIHFAPSHPHAVTRLREQLAQLGLPVKQTAANDAVGESSALSA